MATEEKLPDLTGFARNRDRRGQVQLSAADEEAKGKFLNVRVEYSTQDNPNADSVNRWLDALRDSFNQSSHSQWFHYEARALYLYIIHKFKNTLDIDSAYQLNRESLLAEYDSLTKLPGFSARTRIEQATINSVISFLKESPASDDSQRFCPP